jgi:hypothetical protein
MSFYKRPARRGKKALHLTAATVCLFAIFISAGGHWAVIQSIAYARMLVEFAQQEAWCTALKKTFDDRYACPLCPKIRAGVNQEKKAPPNLSGIDQPEFLLESGAAIFLVLSIAEDLAPVSSRHTDLSTPPPTPPPRPA